MVTDAQDLNVEEKVVLSKFEGEPIPENEFERIHILNGEIVAIHKIENGEIVSTETVKEVD
jgi:hypothetical protein